MITYNDDIIQEPEINCHSDLDYIWNVRFQDRNNISFNILKEFKLDSENLYITKIPNNIINYNSINNILEVVNLFFYKNRYLKEYTPEYHYSFSKKCFMVNEYLNSDKKFRSHIGAHFQPRLEKVVLHPGSNRYFVLDLFDDDSHEFIFWNTNGIKFNWMGENIIPMDTEHRLFKEYFFGLTPDHGSLIPHFCNRKDGPMREESIDYFKTVQNVIKNLKLYINSNKGVILPFKVHDKENANVICTLKNKKVKTFYKALFIIFSNNSYEDDDVYIKTDI